MSTLIKLEGDLLRICGFKTIFTSYFVRKLVQIKFCTRHRFYSWHWLAVCRSGRKVVLGRKLQILLFIFEEYFKKFDVLTFNPI